MLMTSDPNNAGQNPDTVIPSKSQATSPSMPALMIRRNKPKVTNSW
jgi:hypothetical protein